MRQSLVVCTWVLQWVQETICWCFPFPVWEYGFSSIPAPSRHGKQHKTNRPYFKYSLLGKTHYPFGWSLIFHHWNLHWVLIKYLNVLHHLTKAARKVVFSLCAYTQQLTHSFLSYYQNPLPWHTASSRTKALVLFCWAGQQQDVAQSTSQPVQLWCRSSVTLPNRRLCFCAAASGIILQGFCICQLRMNVSKQRAADSKHGTGLRLMLWQSCHSLPRDSSFCKGRWWQLLPCRPPARGLLLPRWQQTPWAGVK